VTTKTETQIPGCFVRFDLGGDFWGEGWKGFFICFGVMGLFYSMGLCGALCLIWCWDGSFLVAVLIVGHV
jgi:hypothetical protein